MGAEVRRPVDAAQSAGSAPSGARVVGIAVLVMDAMLLAVNGTLMRGLELNANLLAAGATFVRETRTAPTYRLWSIGDRHPAMLRVTTNGAALVLELWDVPAAGIADILVKEPAGLCIGKVLLEDGSETLGVLGEPALIEGQREITSYGGWRAYIAARGGRDQLR